MNTYYQAPKFVHKWQAVILGASLVLATILLAVPTTVRAASSISIDSLPPSECQETFSEITITGSATADASTGPEGAGLLQQYEVAIDWGDESIDIVLSEGVFGSGHGISTLPFSGSHTYSSTGSFSIVATIYHQSIEGQDNVSTDQGAFVVCIIEPENTPPVINLNGDNPMDITVGNAYVEPGATADDAEDGLGLLVSNITGFVNHLVIGVYQIFYNFTDSDGAGAAEVTRTINVNPGDTECSDGVNNDGDADVDYPNDSGCDSYADDSENLPPVITVIGDNPLELVVNVDSYSEQGATADDAEDGNGLTVTDIDATGVDTSTVGSYTVYYNFTDSDGADAAQKTRTVNVVAGANECNDTIDNDGDGLVDYPEDPGCDSVDDPSENQPPVITLTGDNPQIVTLNDSYSELGATADDAEDGNGLTVTDIVDTDVDTSTVGLYTVYYNFTDSDGAGAAEVTRTVDVKTACTDGIDNDDDSFTDENDPGCWTDPNNPETYDETDNDETDPVDVCPNDEGIQTNEDQCTPPPPDPILGCTDSSATNYNPDATAGNEDAEECTYPDPEPEPEVSSGGGGGGGGGGFAVCSNSRDDDGDGLIDALDPSCHSDGNAGNPNSYIPFGNSEGESGGEVLGAFSGEVLGESCGLYMEKFIRSGYENDVDQVMKLQTFLNKWLDAGLPVTGVYGPLTQSSINAFQVKYADQILAPWGINAPTGIVYQTTLRWVNMLECPALSLTVPSLIDWSRNPNAPHLPLAVTTTPAPTNSASDVMINSNTSDEGTSDSDLEEQTATVLDAEEATGGFWNFLKGIFGR